MKKPSLSKALMRNIWKRVPSNDLFFNIGKVITRTILKPQNEDITEEIIFAKEIKIKTNLSSFVCNDYYCLDHHYESSTLKLWKNLAQSSEIILDLGSHVGLFSLVAAHSSKPDAKIFAVEADMNNFNMLRENSSCYKNISCINKAISSTGDLLWFCQKENNDGGGFITSNQDIVQKPEYFCQKIPTIKLEDLCREYLISKIDLVKLDLEGLELELMTEECEFWDLHSPSHIIVELTIQKNKRIDYNKLFDTMKRRGYKYKKIQSLYAVPLFKEYDLSNWHFEKA
ncbi:FkbM family methyltransferase [Kamptonema cortianum]|nr:FkbM family methyltransferase [Oscillatoria laete-virens]MDK3160242.1 FkbM family methyltransferase [Kamptonema cortianum]MDL5048404.1 FkbM family methyltransferase [Oscillatoria amoena NRMC-F 0135]MDL5055686.1 FkbM family methyltransferase [Oscillatoria laete-virens NRMC-F 0139]